MFGWGVKKCQAILILSIFPLLFKTLKIASLGRRGGPQIYFLCDLKPYATFQNPTITPSGRKVSEAEEEEKNAVNSGQHAGAQKINNLMIENKLRNVIQVPQHSTHILYSTKSSPLYTCTVQRVTRFPQLIKADESISLLKG